MTKGFINLDKQSGPTSFQMVAAMRRLFDIKKVGHCGTLDPFATGVLPICIGRATAAVQYMEKYDKSYRTTYHLGASTDTQDITGQILSTGTLAETITASIIESAVEELKGKQEQMPPLYSAIKVNGKPLYSYARQGEEVVRKTRMIEVYESSLVSINPSPVVPPLIPHAVEIVVDLKVSKGTYVRTLGETIGEKLGVPVYTAALRRTEVGPFKLETSLTLETLEKETDKASHLLPMDFAFSDFLSIQLSTEQAKALLQGKHLSYIEDVIEDKLYAAYGPFGLVGMVRPKRQGAQVKLIPERMFDDVGRY